MKPTLLALAATLPLATATELPPVIPTGPVTYDNVSYQAPAAPPADTAYTPTYTDYQAPAIAPLQPVAATGNNGDITLNLYSSNYQVRGMGVTDMLSDCGYSSVSGSYILPNRNLFNLGIQQRISGSFGIIWNAGSVLGDTPLFNANYAIGKEIFPNLVAEVGYSMHRGGLEGLMARADDAPHRFAQDVNLSLSYNDRQKGFFGHAIWGIGFQGLTGSYFDFCGGYRFTDIISTGNLASDLEVSAGVSPSFGYWGPGVEGIDAYRVRVALKPYSPSGSFGRDAHLQLTPWVQCSWSGSNAGKIDRNLGCSPVDHFQFTVGVDLGWQF